MFEHKGFVEILIYLYENPDHQINVTELDKNIKATRETILATIRLLRVNRLINEELNKKFPFDHLINLNEKGLKVAVALKAAQNALFGQQHPEKSLDVEPAK